MLEIVVRPVASPLAEWANLRLVLQDRKEFVPGEATEDGLLWRVPLEGRPWLKYGDGRLFLYLTWLSAEGAIVRRIKLYRADIPDFSRRVTVAGLDGKDAPACSTARLLATGA